MFREHVLIMTPTTPACKRRDGESLESKTGHNN